MLEELVAIVGGRTREPTNPVDVAKPIRCAGDVKQLTRAMAGLVAANLGSKKANVRLIHANENLLCEAGG